MSTSLFNHPLLRRRAAICAALLGPAFLAARLAFAATSADDATPADAKPDKAPEVKVDHAAVDRGRTPFMSYAPIVQKVAPSVVKVSVTARAQRRGPQFSGDQMEQLRRFFGGGQGGLGQGGQGGPGDSDDEDQSGGRALRGLGSGVIVSTDGYILTNNHVVKDASTILVTLPDGREFPAKVVGTDPRTDVAVIKIQSDSLPALTFADSNEVSVGDVVLAVGNPFGVGQTVTEGIVSAKDRVTPGGSPDEDFIQTDAAINPGNSGGPLVDLDGRLVGINSEILSGSGGSQGVGFAIPSNLCNWVMTSIVKNGHVERGYLGLLPQPITPSLAKGFHLDRVNGALVGDVVTGSPADRGGLKSGDVIRDFNNQPIKDASQFRLQIAETAPGAKVTLGFVRDGENKTTDVTLGHVPEEKVASTGSREPGEHKDALSGVGVGDLDQGTRAEANVPTDVRGAIITQVAPNSPAYDAGLRPGDVITEINRHPVKNAQDAVADTEKPVGDQTLVKVWSHGTSHFVEVDESGQ